MGSLDTCADYNALQPIVHPLNIIERSLLEALPLVILRVTAPVYFLLPGILQP